MFETHAPTVSVVICAYTEARWDALGEAVASVSRQDYAAHEVLVVIDSNPVLLRRAHAEITSATILQNTGPAGLSGARNTGIRAASGEIVAFLDDDAAASPQWLRYLVDGFREPSVAGVGGWIEPYWLAPVPEWFPTEFHWIVGCSYRGLPPRRAAVRNMIGANMSLRRSVLARVGGFRSELGHAGTRPGGDEETELCIRVSQQWPGSVFLFEPRARVNHRVPADRTTWRYFRARCFAEGRSKSRVSRPVGLSDGLAAERTYALRTLPSGVLSALFECVRSRRLARLARASAIAAGLLITSTAYLMEHVRPTAAFMLDKRAPEVVPA